MPFAGVVVTTILSFMLQGEGADADSQAKCPVPAQFKKSGHELSRVGSLERLHDVLGDAFGLVIKEGRFELSHPAWLEGGRTANGAFAKRLASAYRSIGIEDIGVSIALESIESGDTAGARRALVATAPIIGDCNSFFGKDEYEGSFSSELYTGNFNGTKDGFEFAIAEVAAPSRTLRIESDTREGLLKYEVSTVDGVKLSLILDSTGVKFEYSDPAGIRLSVLPSLTWMPSKVADEFRADVIPVFGPFGLLPELTTRSPAAQEVLLAMIRAESKDAKSFEDFLASSEHARVVHAFRLDCDVQWIIDMMFNRDADADLELLGGRLGVLTGKKFGADRAAWRSWVNVESRDVNSDK